MGVKYAGKNSSAMFGADEFTNFQAWSITVTNQVADATPGSSATQHRQRISGLYGATASVTCIWDETEDVEVAKGTSVTLKLYRDKETVASGYYTGTAICTSVSIAPDAHDVLKVTYEFQYTGTVSVATA